MSEEKKQEPPIRPGFPVFELEEDGDDGCDLLTLVPRKGQTADIQVVALGGEEVLFSLSTLELRELHRAVGRCLGLTNCAQDVTEADDDDDE